MNGRTTRGPVARRAVLLSGVAGLTGALAACAGGDPGSLSPIPGTPAPTPTRTPEPIPTPTLPPVPPYTVLPGEVEPGVKQAAVRYVEAALTASATDAGTGLDARLRAAGLDPGAAAPLLPLLSAQGPSTVRVVYPQYGGLTPAKDQASVMLVAEHSSLPYSDVRGGLGERSESLTLDVRLTRSGGAWTVTQLLPAAPATPAPAISEIARVVLDEERIRLPGASRADVMAGAVDDRVLDVLTALAAQWAVDVTVLVSGHPTNVFNTDRVSNHTLGRAVDLWALDGIPVIDHARAPWKDAMNVAAATGADEIGGPVDLGVKPFFSDAVHQDHVHIGFEAP